MKKVIASLVTLSLLFSCIIAFADEFDNQHSEQISYGVKSVVERLYNNQNVKCEPLDISAQANMGFADDVAGDGKGGWTDQGAKNDMSTFTLFGSQKFLNIPFDIINPDDNDGKSCIILRGQNNPAFPLYVDIPVNDTAYGMYILHSTAYGASEKAGRYYFVYDDGTSSYFDIIGSQHIIDFWQKLNNSYSRIAWKGSNASSANITLNIFALNNPHPEKTIKYIRLESDGEVQYVNIVGLTLAKEPPVLPMLEQESASNTGVIKYAVDTWNKYSDPDESKAKGSALDMSAYLDAPAGKHGVLKAKDDRFFFADGTAAKFWGTNIVGEACFPDKTTAEEISSRLARSGYNLVRFVNIDEKELTDDRLDRLSYLISSLKQNGIYVYFSLLGNAPGEGEQLSDGWKIDGIVRDDLILKSTEFAGKLLTYQNPYTNMSIGSDPVVVMIDMADQNDMFDYDFGKSVLNITDKQTAKELSEKFNSFIKEKYKTSAKLSASWKDLSNEESIENGNLNINGFWQYAIYDQNHKNDIIEFFGKLQSDYCNTVKSEITKSGFKGLVSGFTNVWDNELPLKNAVANAVADFVPVNMMFSYGYDRTEKWPYLRYLKDNTVFIDSDSTVSSDGHDGKALINICKSRVYGKPFVVSEWGAANIGKLYGENSLVMAAFSAQQRWTPIQYCFIQDQINKTQINDVYSTYANPVTLGLSYASAALYYTMDELGTVRVFNQNIDEINRNQANTPVIKEYLTSRSYTKFTGGESDTKKFVSKEFLIDNGGVYWNMLDGMFFAKTPYVICCSGNFKNTETFENIEFEVLASEVSLALVSVDGNELKQSDRMLLTVASDVANIGNTYTSGYLIGKIGDGGIVYSPTICRIVLKNKGDYDIYPLDFNGTRGDKLIYEKTPEGYTEFYTDGNMNFELVRRL